MTVSTRLMAVIVPIAMAVGILLGNVTGWWQTESSKEPARYLDGEFAGQANPADIRGSYSLDDVSAAFEIPVDLLAQAFLVADEENYPAVQLKEFEERYGILPVAGGVSEGELAEREIGTDAMRLFVARYLGLPYEAESDTGMFAPALALIEEAGSLSADEIALLRDRLVRRPEAVVAAADGTEETAVSGDNAGNGDTSAVESPQEAGTDTAEIDGDVDEEYEIKGRTTFGEVIAWGVDEAEILAALDGAMGGRTETIRDWCIAEDIEFSSVKTVLQELVDDAIE